MTVRRRKNRRGRVIGWQVELDRKDPRTGKRVVRTIGTYTTKKEAEAKEREAIRDFERGTSVDPSKVTVGEWLQRWLAGKKHAVTSNTWLDYETAVRKHITPALGGMRLQALSQVDVQDQYDAWVNGDLSARMVHRLHLVLSQACGQAVRLGVMVRNPCDEVALPKLEKRPITVWTPDEVRAFLALADEDATPPLWYFLVVEGMRRGEALGVRWADWNRERGTLHLSQTVQLDHRTGAPVIVPRTKTAAGARTVRLTKRTIAALDAYEGKRPNDLGLVVCTRNGTPLNPSNVTRSFDRMVMVSGVTRIRVHDTRHTAATNLLRAGVALKVVSERMGHASTAITADLYSHVAEDMQESAADAMDRLLDG